LRVEQDISISFFAFNDFKIRQVTLIKENIMSEERLDARVLLQACQDLFPR